VGETLRHRHKTEKKHRREVFVKKRVRGKLPTNWITPAASKHKERGQPEKEQEKRGKLEKTKGGDPTELA